MANVKITGLGPATTPLTGSELLEIVQGGVSVKATAANIAATYAGTLPVAKGGTGATTLSSGQYLKGNGTSAITSTATIPFADLSGRAYCIAYNNGDVTFTAGTATVIQFDVPGLEQGITIENDGSSNPTRVTFEAAGTYEIAFHCQFENADTSDHTGDIWFRLNGTDIPYSASQTVIPKAADGGAAFFQVQGILQATAGQYVEVICAVENVNVSLAYTAAQVSPYARPSIASALIVAQRIA